MICGARTPSNGRDVGWCDLNGTVRLGVASAAQHHVLMAAISTYLRYRITPLLTRARRLQVEFL
jgi:hypothetical protein